MKTNTPRARTIESTQRIAIRALDQAIDPRDVYFPFLDGSLAYNCRTCGAHCCKGFGYHATQRELEGQLQQSPQLALFARPHESERGVFKISNCAPSCFFLTDTGLCRTELVQGRDAKPETCRLFPFNDLGIVDGVLVVAPHASLCPLSLAPTGGDLASSHTQLSNELIRTGISGPVKRLETRARTGGRKAIEEERRVLVIVRERKHEPFLTLLSLCGGGGAQLDRQSPEGLLARLGGFAELLGIPLVTASPAVEGVLVQLLPYLRYRLMFTPVDPRRKSPSMPGGTVESALMVVYLLAVCESQISGRIPTFQTLSSLLSHFRQIIDLLALCPTHQSWSPTADLPLKGIPAEHGRPILALLRDLVANDTSADPVTLYVMLAKLLKGKSTGTRAELLRTLAPRVLPGLISKEASENRPHRISIKRRVQRWGLAGLSDDILMGASRKYSVEPSNPTQ